MKKLLSLMLVLAMLLCTCAALAEGEITLPLTEEPVTFRACVGTSSYCLIPWNDKEIYHKFAEETNVYFDFEELDDYTTQSNLYIASGETPDVFFNSISNATLNENLDMFWELTDMIYEYSPSLVKLYEEEPGVLADSKSPDGGIYKLAASFTFNLDDCLGTMYWINQNWLDAVGMENPTTIDELEEVLVAFRDKDPNGNGIKDEIPMSMQETGWAGKFSDLFGIFGVLYDTGNYVDCDDEGKVYFQADKPEFYDALVWLNHLTKEGLLDAESFSQTGDQFTTKISSNVLGICAKYNPMNFLDGFTTLHVIKNGDTRTMIEGSTDSSLGAGMTLPKTNEYPEVFMKFYEYINSDHSRKMTLRYGEKGVYWDYTGNGIEYTIQDYDSTPPEGYEFWDQYIYTIGTTGGTGPFFMSRKELGSNVSPKTTRETGILEYMQYYPTVTYHAAALTEDLATEKQMLYTEIDAYVRGFVSGSISGEINEQIWQDHLNTLQKLDVERYVELCQMSYDAYLDLIK
ncbi:MAG: extracellular solute-binding protein [Clostridia bacterium]|nr:extracellular solute-binding protein [Clostridia bacterium]